MADAQPKMPSLDDRILVLQQTGLFVDVLRFGLSAVLDKDNHKDIIRQILTVRKTFRKDFAKDLAEFIEFYDPDNYLYHASVAENIIFGDPQDNAFNPHNLPQNEIFIEFLDEAKLREPLLSLGIAFIEELIKFLENRSPDKEILKLSLIEPDQIDIYKSLLYKVKKKGIQRVSGKDHNKILRLILDFVPQKHHFFHLPEDLGNRILEARTLFKEKNFYCRPRCNLILSDFRIYARSIHSDQHIFWKPERRIARCTGKSQYMYPPASD